jgi:cytidine deaminase
MENYSELVKKALEARERAYTPYSNFKVGAALLAASGKVYLGCNIENSGFSGTNCAERTAIFKAVSEGEMKFTAIAVVGGLAGPVTGFCAPCGVCRQVMAEFCDPDEFIIVLATSPDNIKTYKLRELIPLVTFPEGNPDGNFFTT